MDKKKIFSRFLILIGIGCIIVALLIVSNNIYMDKKGKKLAEKNLKALETEINIDENKTKGEGRMESIEVSGKKYIGILTVPKLGLKLPIQLDWSYENLETSPCRYTGSVNEDTMVLMGHNYNSHFSKLKTLNIGDEIIFVDVKGVEYKYKLKEKEILHKTKVQEMVTGNWDLTLFTCDYNRINRVALRCERII